MTSSRRPNIVLIVSDDHGYADRSNRGMCDDVATPVLDALADDGVSCTDAYVSAPVCSPSRAGLLSGAYQQRWGARWFDDSQIGPASFPTIAERLAERGYTTGYFGKVHYGSEGHDDRGAPPEHGFDESFFGLAGQSMGRLNYLRHSTEATAEYGQAAAAMGVQPLWASTDGGPAGEESGDGFLTEMIGQRAASFIEDHRHEPFFTYVAFNAVHNFAWQLPEDELHKRGLPAVEDWYPGAGEYLDWYDGAINPNLENGRAYYLAQLELMDREIGRVLDRLRTLGLEDDTLVIYLTDNGGSNCNYGRNDPLSGTKYTLLEGGIRVPFIAKWPGRIPAGESRDALVSSMDILPTVLAAAEECGGPATDGRRGSENTPVTGGRRGSTNAPVSGGRRGSTNVAVSDERRVGDGVVDGVDLLGLLAGSGDGGHEVLHWDCGFQWAVRRGPWKLRYADGASPVAEHLRAVEHTDIGDGITLTNLNDDVAESVDLSARYPRLVEELTELHDQWLKDVNPVGAATGR